MCQRFSFFISLICQHTYFENKLAVMSTQVNYTQKKIINLLWKQYDYTYTRATKIKKNATANTRIIYHNNATKSSLAVLNGCQAMYLQWEYITYAHKLCIPTV